MPERIAIFGLGNPGPKYQGTRHNIGFDWVDRCVSDVGGLRFSERFSSSWCHAEIEGAEVHLLQPMTFMNLSGRAVREWREKFPSATRILVAFDDMDIPLGRVRLRGKGSDGGHRGMRSVLGLNPELAVNRLRLGVGRPADEAIDYVLSRFTPNERLVVERVLDGATAQLKAWLAHPLEKAMNIVNGMDYSLCL